MDAATKAALAAEVKRQAIEKKLVAAETAIMIMKELATQVSARFNSVTDQATALRGELSQLDADNTWLSQDIGEYSMIEQGMRAERFPAKEATILYIQSNPLCTEEKALEIYTAAALAARPADRQYLVINPASLLWEYRKNAKQVGILPDDTWETFRAFLLQATPEMLMGM